MSVLRIFFRLTPSIIPAFFSLVYHFWSSPGSFPLFLADSARYETLRGVLLPPAYLGHVLQLPPATLSSQLWSGAPRMHSGWLIRTCRFIIKRPSRVFLFEIGDAFRGSSLLNRIGPGFPDEDWFAFRF